jgi:hypothetical protein
MPETRWPPLETKACSSSLNAARGVGVNSICTANGSALDAYQHVIEPGAALDALGVLTVSPRVARTTDGEAQAHVGLGP